MVAFPAKLEDTSLSVNHEWLQRLHSQAADERLQARNGSLEAADGPTAAPASFDPESSRVPSLFLSEFTLL